MKALLLVAVILLTGCAGFGMGGLSADQINAAVKDKASAVACTTFTGMGGQFQVMFVNNDKTFNTGGGTTTVECGTGKVTFHDAGKSAPVSQSGTTTTVTVPATTVVTPPPTVTVSPTK